MLAPKFSLLFALQIAAVSFSPWVLSQEEGTSFGIPNSSPGVFWPRGFGYDAQNRLYPNGPQFGLSNTSGGFGMTGSGQISGVGLEQRGISPLARAEFYRAALTDRRLFDSFSAEAAKSSAIFSVVLGNRFRSEMQVPTSLDYTRGSASPLISPFGLPSIDSVLHDQAASTDSILRSNL